MFGHFSQVISFSSSLLDLKPVSSPHTLDSVFRPFFSTTSSSSSFNSKNDVDSDLPSVSFWHLLNRRRHNFGFGGECKMVQWPNTNFGEHCEAPDVFESNYTIINDPSISHSSQQSFEDLEVRPVLTKQYRGCSDDSITSFSSLHLLHLLQSHEYLSFLGNSTIRLEDFEHSHQTTTVHGLRSRRFSHFLFPLLLYSSSFL